MHSMLHLHTFNPLNGNRAANWQLSGKRRCSRRALPVCKYVNCQRGSPVVASQRVKVLIDKNHNDKFDSMMHMQYLIIEKSKSYSPHMHTGTTHRLLPVTYLFNLD